MMCERCGGAEHAEPRAVTAFVNAGIGLVAVVCYGAGPPRPAYWTDLGTVAGEWPDFGCGECTQGSHGYCAGGMVRDGVRVPCSCAERGHARA